jgi:ABC-type nitrate/sulfonate/bicarbonate transport system substrate-binding protein
MRLAAGSGPTFGVDDLACAAATHLGSWADEGLDVEWIPVHGGVAAIEAVLGGRVDASYGGLGPVMRSRSHGKPVRIIVSMARGLAQNLVVQRHITAPAELRGASWALDGFGALSHHMSRLLVRALGIGENEIDWQAVGPPPQRIERLLAGTIDASLIRVEEAIALDLDPSNTVHTLLGFAELKRLVPVQPHGVLATLEAYEIAHPEHLHRLAKGMIRASRALHDDFEAFRRVYEHYVTVKVPLEMVRTIWRQERETGGFAVNGELSEPHWRRQTELLYELDPDLARVDLRDVIAHRFVERALSEIGRMQGAHDTTGA